MDFDDREYLIEIGGSAIAANGPDSLHDIQCYFEAMEAFLGSTAGERQLRLRAMRDRIDPKISDFLAKTENELLWDDYFPSELRASILVSAMSFLERYLNGVCAEAAILLRKPISHTKIKGSSIDRAKTYLTELCAFRRPNQARWESIKVLQRLRNVLVHDGGTFETPSELKRIENLTQNLEGVCCHELGVDLDSKFIRFALGEISLFLDEMKSAFEDICEDVARFEGKT